MLPGPWLRALASGRLLLRVHEGAEGRMQTAVLARALQCAGHGGAARRLCALARAGCAAEVVY